MAKFLNTRRIIAEIEGLINDSDDNLILISPYLKLSKDLMQRIQHRDKSGKHTTFVFRHESVSNEVKEFFSRLKFKSILWNEDLHAKCYLNMSKMILTSLNLYSFSIENNKEMGILIDRAMTADRLLYDDARSEVDFIIDTSKRYSIDSNNNDDDVEDGLLMESVDAFLKSSPNSKNGYCIRTGVEIPFDIEKPFSKDSFKVWSEYGDADYPERFCHFSGEPTKGENSKRYPVLSKNWKNATREFGIKDTNHLQGRSRSAS